MSVKNKKSRLDMLLVNKGFFSSREKARAAIMAGKVYVEGQKADKPGKSVGIDAGIEVTGFQKYASRGGLKLEKALTLFNVDLKDRVVLDIGASTGGFTDCALQHGARRVYAVDVGYGQLDWSLRNDPRVTVMERTNIRYVEKDLFSEKPDFVTVDVSFISLALVMPKIDELTGQNASAVVLIKPQFEAGREKVGRKGVVRDPGVHVETINKVCGIVSNAGWGIKGLDYSPVKGPEGNIEYLLYIIKNTQSGIDLRNTVDRVVESAHLSLY